MRVHAHALTYTHTRIAPPPPGAAYGAYMATAMPQLAQNLPPAQVNMVQTLTLYALGNF